MHSFKCMYTAYDGIYFSSYIISEGSSQLPEAETRAVLAKRKSSFFLFSVWWNLMALLIFYP